MTGEIGTAYLAILPSMRGFGTAVVQAGIPQMVAAGQQLGEQAGLALGTALGEAVVWSVAPPPPSSMSSATFEDLSWAAQRARADVVDVGQAIRDLASSILDGAVAGVSVGSVFAEFGGPVAGAAIGTLVGLVGGIWEMSAAMQAANTDTDAAQQLLQSLGVEATLAARTMDGLTSEQLAAVGGFDAVRSAMQAGTYKQYIAGLQEQSDALDKQVASIHAQQEAMLESGRLEGVNSILVARTDEYQNLTAAADALTPKAESLRNALSALGANSEYFARSQEQVTYQAYASAYAMDIQTGALGATSEATWQAIVAQGGLSTEALQSMLQMERLGGVAGYATEMITGIPNGTRIDFDSNALDIAKQIAALVVAQKAAASVGQAIHMQGLIDDLQAQFDALAGAGPVVKPRTGGGGGGGGGRSAAANAAKQAADEAARKLKQDQQAQLRFADAFGSLMEAALGGNFDQYRDRLESQIESLARDGYQAAADTLKRLSGTLTQSSLDYAALTNKLKKASDAYDDLTKRMRDQYDTSRELVLGMAKVTDAVSFDQLAYLLGETTSAATQYQEVLKQLKDQGLSEQLWNQLAAAGPESMGLAQSILDQGQAGIDQLNTLTGTLVDAADSMGDLVSQSMYQQGVDAMNAYIEGLRSQSSALEAQLTTIANNILTQTAGAITPGNAGYSPISSEAKTTANTYQVSLNVNASSLGDIQSIQDFIQKLESAPTSQLVNQAGTVTS